MATILVVDDKDMMRDSLSLALARAGHKAVTTGDPLEAAGLVRQHRPACVITDLKMPKMDGMELLGSEDSGGAFGCAGGVDDGVCDDQHGGAGDSAGGI